MNLTLRGAPFRVVGSSLTTNSGLLSAWTNKARILGRFLTWQVLIQIVSALSGLILVRLLGKAEFALYTVATSIQTTLSAISDGGISIGLTSVGGRVWRDRGELSRLTATAIYMRRQMLGLGAIVAIPFGVWLLHRTGASTASNAIGLLIVFGTVFFVLNVQIFAVPFRLHGAYGSVQKAELMGSVCRVLFILVVVFFAPNFLIALLGALLGFGLQAWQLKRNAYRFVDYRSYDGAFRNELGSLARTQAVQTIFFAFQGQITIWLISFFGTGERVAEMGALTRLAALFSLVSSVLIGIVSPAFARAQTQQKLRSLFAICLSAYIVLSIALITLTFFFPAAFLWLLGSKYGDLSTELSLSVIGIVIGGLIAVLWTLPAARGMVRGTWMIAVGTIGTQLVLLRVLDLSTVRSALLFNIISSIPTVLVVAFLAARALRSELPAIGSKPS
jgi:O-antigen/teichoic acid export membrane protein